MKKFLITQTSLGGFVRPQAEAEVLGLRGRQGECGRLGLWARGPLLYGAGSDPCRQRPAPGKEPQASSPGLQLAA